MKRLVLPCTLVAVMAVLPCSANAQSPPVVPFVQADAQIAAIEILSEPASYDFPFSDQFTELEAAARCSRTRLRASDTNLRWKVERPQAQAHRVDISMFHDGFKTGRYLTSGARAGAERELVFEDALPGVYYYWRLLTKTPEGWVVSGAGRFDSPICPADKVPE